MSAARTVGISKPEGPMIAGLLGRVIEKRPELFDRFLEILQYSNQTMHFLGFASGFIKNIHADLKAKAIPALSSVLVAQSSIRNQTQTDYIIDALTSLGDDKLNEKVTSELIPKTLGPNPMQVLFATRVLSKVAGTDDLKQMLVVLDKTLDEWYGQQNNEIQDQVVLYLTRCPNVEAVPRIGRLLPLRRSTLLMQMIHSFQFKSTADLLQDMIDQNTLVDLRRIVSNDVLFGKYWNSKSYIKKILLSDKDIARPMVFDMLRSTNEDKYTFAAECLAEMGVTLDEMSNEFRESPANEIYRFFYPKETPEKIWEDRNTRSLGGTIGARTKRFDFFLMSILSSFNFQVLYVDSANKPGVDLVALSPMSNAIVIAGNTISSLKNDISNLSATVEEMKEKMGDLMKRYITYPVILSASKNAVTSEEAKFAKQTGIIVLDGASVQQILTMSRTGRTASDLVSFLKAKQIEPLPVAFPNLAGL